MGIKRWLGKGLRLGAALTGLGGLDEARKLIRSANPKDTDKVVEALLDQYVEQDKRIAALEGAQKEKGDWNEPT